jgi:prepilin-type N-terminal cleavage/methylation domain-containing protein
MGLATQDPSVKRLHLSRRRGFTLIEVLVVIFMIALLAAIASPAFVRMMRDISLSRLAMQFSEMYRRAYVESADHAVVLRWDTTDPENLLEVRRGRLDLPGNATPTLIPPHGCNTINWALATSYERTTFKLRGSDTPDLASMTFLDPAGTTQSHAEICYTRHRAFVRYDQGAPFVALDGVARIRVKNLKTTAVREVLIPPHGLSRVWQ